MTFVQKVAMHVLLYCIWAALFIQSELALGSTIHRWDLFLAYGLYLVAATCFHVIRKQKVTTYAIMAAIILPIVLLSGAWLVGHTYDTSWDGEDYQQSAVIALAKGWNPWYSASLPIHASTGTDYTLGYPKVTWLLQASVYKLTGYLQDAIIFNFMAAGIAAVFVYTALRRIGITVPWSISISAFAVLQIHFLQQAFLFMTDGYSYELSLIAIASLVLFIKDNHRICWLLAFISAWFFLVGTKFSNLPIAAILALLVLAYLLKVRPLRLGTLLRMGLVSFLVGVILLWMPYGINMLRYGSPLYPQNLALGKVKLRYDNVPNNVKRANAPELLFYGIFAASEPKAAGDAHSSLNVAQLKIPFTFHWYEADPQGRVGSGGIFFSGMVVVAGIFITFILWHKPPFRTRGMLAGIAILDASIVTAALVTPVPNVLRYTPLISLLPITTLVLLIAIRGTKPRWAWVGIIILTCCLISNIAISAQSIMRARLNDIRVIRGQLTALQQSKTVYHVDATHFYTNYVRLQEAHVPFVIDEHLTCTNPQTLVYTYGTTFLCPAPQH